MSSALNVYDPIGDIESYMRWTQKIPVLTESEEKALIEKGFSVEISSATNEKSIVKGHLKVKRNG